MKQAENSQLSFLPKKTQTGEKKELLSLSFVLFGKNNPRQFRSVVGAGAREWRQGNELSARPRTDCNSAA
jgi:hypothetical protein